MWELAYESGEDYLGTSDDIELSVGWAGERGVLTRALVEAGAPEGEGFIETLDTPASSTVHAEPRFRIHDLWHHAPDYVKKRRDRELERRQKQAPPTKRRRTADNGSHFTPPSDPLSRDGRTPSPSPSPSPSPQVTSSEPLRDSEPTPPSPTVMEFPTVGTGGASWALTHAQLATWASLYPTIDVPAEARKALAWLDANPGRRKTSRGMPAFLVSWFNRHTDRPGGGDRTPPSRPAPAPVRDFARKWACPHVEECGSGVDCRTKQTIDPLGVRYPLTDTAEVGR